MSHKDIEKRNAYMREYMRIHRLKSGYGKKTESKTAKGNLCPVTDKRGIQNFDSSLILKWLSRKFI